MNHVKFSVIVPVYNEWENLSELIRRCLHVCRSTGRPFEIIFVDDRSIDSSREMLQQASRENPEIKTLVLNRNYGRQAALFAGLEQSVGKVAITLAADLQNPPEEILKLLEAMDEGFDIVGTVRSNCRDSWFRQMVSNLTNKAIQRATGVWMHDYGSPLRAYRRNIVNAMLQSRERSTCIPILANGFAARTCEIPVRHFAPAWGDPRNSLRKWLSLQFQRLSSIPAFPLQLLFLIGACLSILGFGLLLTIPDILYGAAEDRAFMLSPILFIFIGAQWIGLGLLGKYIGDHTQGRPRFFIEEIYTFEDANEDTKQRAHASDIRMMKRQSA